MRFSVAGVLRSKFCRSEFFFIGGNTLTGLQGIWHNKKTMTEKVSNCQLWLTVKAVSNSMTQRESMRSLMGAYLHFQKGRKEL